MELEKYRNDQEVSQSFLVNMEAPDVTENHRDYNVRKSLKCSKRASQVENDLSTIAKQLLLLENISITFNNKKVFYQNGSNLLV